MFINPHKFFLTLSLCSLGACGGGGGGGGGSSPSPAPPTGPSVAQIASASVSAAMTARLAATTSVGAMGQPSDPASNPIPDGGTARLAITPFECSSGGSLALLFSDTNGNNQREEGESFSLNFALCQLSTSVSVNGVLSVEYSEFTRATDIWLSARAQINYESLVIQTPEGGSRLNGKLDVQRTDTAEKAVLLAVVTEFAGTATNAQGADVSTVTLSNMTITDTAWADGTESFDLGGQVSGTWPGLTGSLSLSTEQTLVLGSGGTLPTAGVLVSNGSDGILTLRFNSQQGAQAELDRNKDGAPESVTQLSSADLLGQ